MATPKQAQPEREPTAAANQPPASPAAQDTKRPTDSTPIATGTFAKLPMRFGRYQVEKLLGRGAMGAVYLARDMQLERLVALKIPKISATGSARLLKRLKTEAKAAAQIDHPCVCHVHDSGDIDGTPFIAMQYIEGETLKDHLKNQAKTPAEVVELVIHLAEGLSEAHSKGIYHRDLKPENIKLNRRGVPVIMDFGLAKLATTLNADASATQAGTTLGTPAYMSPEQANGKVEEIDHRSDIYALGVILFELLTRQWPFAGSAMQVMAQKTILEPPSPQTVKPDLDPQLAAVCHKLIAKKREDRYQNATEVIAALKAIGLTGALPPDSTQQPFGSSTDASITDFLKEISVGSPKPVAPKKSPAPLFGKDKSGKDKKKLLLIGGGILSVLVLLAGLVVKLKTKGGTLIVTVNELDAEVLVLTDDDKVEITLKSEKGPLTIAVVPGKHRLKVTKDGFEFFTQDFSIESGGKQPITAMLVPLDEEPVVAMTKPAPAAGAKKSLAFETPGFDQWVKEVAALSAEEQVKAVAKKLVELNPGFDGKVDRVWDATPIIENGAVVSCRIVTDNVTDILPLRAFAGLQALICWGSQPGKGKLADLSPIRDMKLLYFDARYTQVSDLSPLKGMPLNALDFSKTQVSELSPLKDLKLTHLSFRDTPVSDLTPLKDMMLIGLNCSLTKVSDLSPLKDMPLTGLAIEGTQVSDLSPIRGMQLTNLVMEGNHVADLSPLRDMPLKTLTLDFKPFRDTELLRSIKTLETIQNKPAAEFWKDVEEQQSGNENAAITVISPDAIRMHKLEVDQPRLYDANPPRRIEGVIEELEGWQFISIPQRITNSYEIRVNRAGIIYAFGGGPKQTAAETFGKEVAQWEPAVGAIKGKNVNLCFRRKVIAGELITLKAFELQLAAESIAIKK